MSITGDIAQRILAFLFPPVCIACGVVEGLASLPIGLCSTCRGELQPLDRFSCQTLCHRPSALDAIFSGWSYEPPFESVIHALKFSRMEFLGPDMAVALHFLLADLLPEVDVIVPIPLHWYRRSRRGYNQAEAIARPLARLMSRPMVSALRRTRWTRPQARLGRHQRDLNLRLAFAPVRAHRTKIARRRLLLVDDVVTTGATLEAAARCLREAGAESITALTAGRTLGKH